MKNKGIRTFLKRATAVFLVLAMSLGYFTFFEFTLFANTLGFTSGFDQNLIPSTDILNPSPNLGGDISENSGQIHLSFVPTFSNPPTTYRVQFPVGNNEGASLQWLEITMTSPTTAMVNYSLSGNFAVNIGTPPGAAGVNFVEMHPASFAQPAGTTAYTYYPIVGDTAFFANTTDVPSQPSFGVGLGQGFSFRPSGVFPAASANMDTQHAMSFLLDADGVFHIVVGGLEQQGHIYNFELHVVGAAGNPQAVQNVFLGFDYAARPVARHREYAREDYIPGALWATDADDPLFLLSRNPFDFRGIQYPLGWTYWDIGLRHRANWLLHMFSMGDTRNDWYPGGYMPYVAPNTDARRDNLLEFVIEIPYVFIGTGFVPQTLAAAQAMFNTSTFNFYIADDDPDAAIQFNVQQIFSNDPQITGLGPPATATGVVHISPATPTSNRVTVLVDGPQPFSLGASRMFHNSILSFAVSGENPNPPGLHSVRSSMSLAGLHTFLGYSVEYIDGQFYVRIRPYAGIYAAGSYRLQFDTPHPISEVIVVDSDGSGRDIFIPLNRGTIEYLTFNVLFTPSGLLTGVGTIQSQWMRIYFTPDRMVLSAPTHFTVNPNTPELSYILNADGLAEFDITASWRMSDFAAMLAYFDLPEMAGREHVTFTYEINSRTSPDGEPIHIATADITVRRNPDIPGGLQWAVTDINYNIRTATNPDGFPFPAGFVFPPNTTDWVNLAPGPITVSVPLRFVADYIHGTVGSPFLFESIYFLTSTLIQAQQAQLPTETDPPLAITLRARNLESSHNLNSFLALSRPDIREFPPPFDLNAAVNAALNQERVGGHFDIEFGVAWREILNYLTRSAYTGLAADQEIMFRIFLGGGAQNADIATLALLDGEERTDAINAGDVLRIVHENAPDPSLSLNNDFNFAGWNITNNLDNFNITNFITPSILAGFPNLNHTQVDNAFRTHLQNALGQNSIEDWLYAQAEGSPAPALLDSAWTFIRQGVAITNAHPNYSTWFDPFNPNTDVNYWDGSAWHGWETAPELNATVAAWAAAFASFDFVAALQAASLATDQFVIGDFVFTPAMLNTPINQLNIVDFMRPAVRDNFLHTNAALRARLNTEFRQHLLRTVGGLQNITGAQTLAQWLRFEAAGNPSNALLNSAWPIISTGVLITPLHPLYSTLWHATNNTALRERNATNDGWIGWEDMAAVNATITAWNTAFSGFAFGDFINTVDELNSVPNNWSLPTLAQYIHPSTTATPAELASFIAMLGNAINSNVLLNAQSDIFHAIEIVDTAHQAMFNNALNTHMQEALGLSAGQTLINWLRSEAGGLNTPNSVLAAGWDAIVTGGNWTAAMNIPQHAYDATAPWGGWANQAALNTSRTRLLAALTGFNLAPFLRDDFQAPHVDPPPAGAIGTHSNLVNGVNTPLQIFDMSDVIQYVRTHPIVIEVPLSSLLLGDGNFLQGFGFEGLDANWQYTMFVDSFVQFNLPNPSVREYSNTTNIAAVTTNLVVVPPDPGEVMPGAPRDLRVDTRTNNSATVSWLESSPPAGDEVGRIEYEVVRMRGNQVLPQSLLNNRTLSIGEFRNALEAIAQGSFEVGVRTDRQGNTLRFVLPGTNVAAPHFTLANLENNRVQFINSGLVPNTLYFYYVRTVWITGTGSSERVTYSAWNGVSVTTTIIEAPENLRILDGRAFDNLTIDPTTQMIIQFEMRGPTLDHGSVFNFRYQLRQDSGMWGNILNLPSAVGGFGGGGTPRLLSREDTFGRPGYITLTYLIGDLLPGTTYSVRVHALDIVNNDAASPLSQVYSEWSNIATTRTDMDQDHYNRDRDRENLANYLRDLLHEFIRRPYWVAQDTVNAFTAIYRPTMLNELLATSGTLIHLASSEQDVNTFYLPQELFLRIWDSGQGFVFAQGDMTVTVPNRAINSADSEPVLQTLQRIRDVQTVRDYYVRLTADVRDLTTHVGGFEAAGQQVAIAFEVVETNAVIRQTDETILRTLQHRIETDYYLTRVLSGQNSTFMAQIAQMVAQDMPRPNQIRRLYEMAEIIMREMSSFVQTTLSQTRGRVMSFNVLSQPMSITLNNVAASDAIGGHQFAANQWVPQIMQQQGTSRVMHTQVPGRYAFSRQFNFFFGIENLPNHDRLLALIQQYGLGDFIGAQVPTFDINAPISLTAVQGITARIGGATTTQNPQDFLRSRGYIVVARGTAAPAQTQEAIYYIMALYEMRTGTRVSSLRITNFNTLNGIAGIDARFRPFIQGAVELNIFNPSGMQPTAPMTVGDFLRMLSLLDQRIGL